VWAWDWIVAKFCWWHYSQWQLRLVWAEFVYENVGCTQTDFHFLSCGQHQSCSWDLSCWAWIFHKCWWWHYSQSKSQFSDLVTTIHGWLQDVCRMLAVKVWDWSEVWLSHNLNFSLWDRSLILHKCWWWHYSQSKSQFSDLVTTIQILFQDVCTMLAVKVWDWSEPWFSHNPSFSFV